MKQEERKGSYMLTKAGEKKVSQFLIKCRKKRIDILAEKKDTAFETKLPTQEDILSEVNFGVGLDEDGEYYNCWGITDNYDSPALGLIVGEDLRLFSDEKNV